MMSQLVNILSEHRSAFIWPSNILQLEDQYFYLSVKITESGVVKCIFRNKLTKDVRKFDFSDSIFDKEGLWDYFNAIGKEVYAIGIDYGKGFQLKMLFEPIKAMATDRAHKPYNGHLPRDIRTPLFSPVNAHSIYLDENGEVTLDGFEWASRGLQLKIIEELLIN